MSQIKQLPAIYAQDGKGNSAMLQRSGFAYAYVRFFCPLNSWQWYATEANAILADGTECSLQDPRAEQAKDIQFFGLVKGDYEEFGYFNLSELLPYVSEDPSFQPCEIGQIRQADNVATTISD